MRISARNQIKGTVVEVKKGATTSHIRVDIGNGQIVTSSITNESVDDLGLKTGGAVIVVATVLLVTRRFTTRSRFARPRRAVRGCTR